MFTPDELEAMEEENMMRMVLEMEEEMQEANKPSVPWKPEDGEETDQKQEGES